MKKVWYVLSVSVLLIALILGGALSTAASTANEGTCGAEATWSFADGVLTISGAGAMENYENDAPWAHLSEQITSVVIGKKITTIGETAFSGLGNLETVTLEKNSQLTSIGKGAFYSCSKLTGISVPAGVTTIGEWALYGCAELTSIDFCGTQAEWNAIDKGGSWDAVAGAYTVHYLHDGSNGAWENVSETLHQKACAQCSRYALYAEHTWVISGTVAATHTTEGKITYACVCGASKEVTIEKVADCTYNGYEMVAGDEVNHKRVCACGEKIDENHDWKVIRNVAATHTSEGLTAELCMGCGMTRTTPVPKTEAHSYKTLISLGAETHKGVCACGEESEPVAHTWGRATIIKQPTHTEYGLQTSTCACGEIKVETVAPKANEHKYGEWTSYGDANQHKKACECGDVVYASHAWGNGEVTTEATHMAEGVRTYTCADCEQTKTEAIPMTPDHKCETWTSVDGAQHQAACVECGLTVYADHTWNEGEVITAQTHVTSGEMKYTCEDCGAEKIEVILAGHAYGEWEKNDASQHKASCSCGHVIYEAHDWDEGMVTREATHTVYGEMTYTCAVCGQTKTDRIEKTTEHTFSDVWVEHDATRHKKVCACGEAEYAEHSYDWVEHDDEDMHKKACACGSEILGIHKWEVKTVEPTCAKEGQKIYTCSDCGQKNTITIEKLSHTYGDWTKHDGDQHKKSCTCGHAVYDSHSWDKGTVIAEATEQAEGKIKYTCAGCGGEKTEAIPKLDSVDVVEAGCGATVAGGAALMLLLSIGSATLVCKKKED